MLGPEERFRLASRVLAAGLPYVGADFRLEPPELAPFQLPSIGVIGTGKRVGKTAVTGHLARVLAADHDVVVVAMGRGGPEEPEVAPSAAHRRGAARALPRRAPCRVRLPRGRGLRRDPDDRLPPGGRRARRGRPPTRTSSAGAELAASLRPDLVDLRGERRRAAAGGDGQARPGRFRAPAAGAHRRLPQPVPNPDLRPGRPDDGRGRSPVRADPRAGGRHQTGPACRPGATAAPARLCDRGSARRVLHHGAPGSALAAGGAPVPHTVRPRSPSTAASPTAPGCAGTSRVRTRMCSSPS